MLERQKQQMNNSKWDLSYMLRKARFAFEVNHGMVENVWTGHIHSFQVYIHSLQVYMKYSPR